MACCSARAYRTRASYRRQAREKCREKEREREGRCTDAAFRGGFYNVSGSLMVRAYRLSVLARPLIKSRENILCLKCTAYAPVDADMHEAAWVMRINMRPGGKSWGLYMRTPIRAYACVHACMLMYVRLHDGILGSPVSICKAITRSTVE